MAYRKCRGWKRNFRGVIRRRVWKFEYLRPEKVYEAVVTDQADLGLMSYAESTKEVTVLPWREEQMVVAASPHHALANKSEVRPEELEGAGFRRLR